MDEYYQANLRNTEKYKILMGKIEKADEERIALSNTLTTLKTENQRFNVLFFKSRIYLIIN